MKIVKALAFALGVASVAEAHELWIEPTSYQIASGETATADIRVGENMDGPAYSYLPRDFKRFDLVQGGTLAAVEGRMGDRPALQQAVDAEGLLTVAYVSRDLSLTYTQFEKFAKFARHKDFEWALEEHTARGLSTDRFKERYIRYAKSLIAVGAGQGMDAEVGLETEIVALANPYTDDLSQGFPVKVLYEGAPRADVQVELFAKSPDGSVEVTLHRTDAEGVAMLPVAAGLSYLADAVVIRAADPDTANGAVWDTLWASLTFAVPAE